MAMYGGSNADSWDAAAATTSSDGGEPRINFNDRTEGFLMYIYKVKLCSKTSRHDWTECPYAHPGEKAGRRDPRRYPYSGIACLEFQQRGQCQRGHSCAYAHGVFESWLHPTRFRTRLCVAGNACTRRLCFFAHTFKQLRQEVIRDCIRGCVVKPSRGDMPAVGAAAASSSSFASAFLAAGMNGLDGNGLLDASFYSSSPSFQYGMDEVNGNDLVGGGEEWCDFPHRDLVEGLLTEK